MDTFARKATKVVEGVSIVSLLVLFLSVLIQIIMRNLFATGSVVLEELARYCLVTLVFLMAPVLLIDNQHVLVDFLVSKISGAVKKCVEFVVHVVSFCFVLFLIFSVAQVLMHNWSVRTPAMHMPNSIFYIPIIISLLLMLVIVISNIVMDLKKKEDRR